MTRSRAALTARRCAPPDYDHLHPLFVELAHATPDSPGQGAVRERLVRGHLPIAEHIAHRFRSWPWKPRGPASSAAPNYPRASAAS
jgi:RNA polymerase sigma-B factor